MAYKCSTCGKTHKAGQICNKPIEVNVEYLKGYYDGVIMLSKKIINSTDIKETLAILSHIPKIAMDIKRNIKKKEK